VLRLHGSDMLVLTSVNRRLGFSRKEEGSLSYILYSVCIKNVAYESLSFSTLTGKAKPPVESLTPFGWGCSLSPETYMLENFRSEVNEATSEVNEERNQDSFNYDEI
jgi:hypothetical protein